MTRAWVVIGLVILVVLGGAFYLDWKDDQKLAKMGNVMESIPEVDEITVKDGETGDDVLRLTESYSTFDELVDVYSVYHELKGSEKKLLKNDSFVDVNYLKNDDVRFTISIYQVEDDEKSLVPDEEETDDSFRYTLEENGTYIFAINEVHQLLRVNEGLKELLHTIVININKR